VSFGDLGECGQDGAVGSKHGDFLIGKESVMDWNISSETAGCSLRPLHLVCPSGCKTCNRGECLSCEHRRTSAVNGFWQ